MGVGILTPCGLGVDGVGARRLLPFFRSSRQHQLAEQLEDNLRMLNELPEPRRE